MRTGCRDDLDSLERDLEDLEDCPLTDMDIVNLLEQGGSRDQGGLTSNREEYCEFACGPYTRRFVRPLL